MRRYRLERPVTWVALAGFMGTGKSRIGWELSRRLGLNFIDTDRVIERVRSSGVERAVCFAHGHSLRALTVRWLQLDLTLGARFPLDTGTVSVLGEAKGVPALERWNAGFTQVQS